VLAAGVDDAGRGSIIGPLVIAGVLHPSELADELWKLGVKDSKRLTPARRSRLAERIKEAVEAYEIVEIPPSKIDEVVAQKRKFRRLNFLEAQVMARVLAKLKPQIAYVDSCDPDTSRFASHLAELLPFKVKIVCEHKAEEKFALVAAASILAKVHRDRAVEKLKNLYGDFGSGYPSDPRTIRFLDEWLKKHGDYPSFVRKTWKTLRRLQPSRQLKMEDLGGEA